MRDQIFVVDFIPAFQWCPIIIIIVKQMINTQRYEAQLGCAPVSEIRMYNQFCALSQLKQQNVRFLIEYRNDTKEDDRYEMELRQSHFE